MVNYDFKNSRFDLIKEPSSNGVTLTFPNGVVASVCWGHHSQSDGTTSAECSAFYKESGDWVHVPGFKYGDGHVLSRLSSVEAVMFLDIAARINPKDFLVSNIKYEWI